LRTTVRVIKKRPEPTKRKRSFSLRSNLAMNFYICYWYVFVAI